jgi:hypothetical protein
MSIANRIADRRSIIILLNFSQDIIKNTQNAAQSQNNLLSFELFNKARGFLSRFWPESWLEHYQISAPTFAGVWSNFMFVFELD